MRENKIKKMMKDNKPILNGWLQIPNSNSAEIISNKYIKSYFEDFKQLNVNEATVYPKATEHIDDMINLIQSLVEKNIASRSQIMVAGSTDGRVLAVSPSGCWLLFVSGVLNVLIRWVVTRDLSEIHHFGCTRLRV